jgi:protein involved in polysaccharide export with SLBB domain
MFAGRKRRRMPRPRVPLAGALAAAILGLLAVVVWPACEAAAQQPTPEMLREAARRSGLSEAEILRRWQQEQSPTQPPRAPDAADVAEPGRTTPVADDDIAPGVAGQGRGERSYWVESPQVRLPLSDRPLGVAEAEAALDTLASGDRRLDIFGRSFFRLAAGVFNPPSFGPVPADYLVGAGDEIVVDVWGEVEFRIERIVDRDGSIILPRGGKVICHNRTLREVSAAVRERLERSYAGLKDGSIQLDVTLGRLRAIRVYVIGDVEQPGAYELSSVATILTALYAAGGPAETGSLRDVRLLRDGGPVSRLDVYRYLLDGVREGDAILREGDTVLVPPRGRTVLLQGAVRRPAFYELLPAETFDQVLRFAGGFTPQAATQVLSVERVVPPAERAPDQPDRTFLNLHLDPASGALSDPQAGQLRDGDVVTVGQVADKLWGWVQIKGHVKYPGRYQYRRGLTVGGLIEQAGGAWPDVLLEVALIDRIDEREQRSSLTVPLGQVLRGETADVPLQERDVLQVFAEGTMRDRETVTVSGEVREPGTFEYRRGLTLRDLLVRAAGLPPSADLERVEIQRLQAEKVFSNAAQPPVGSVVQTLRLDLTPDVLVSSRDIPLEPFDHVVVRRLPWYQKQRQVTVRGEVFYNGIFSLETADERLASLVARAGGLKPEAYARGARIEREELGNLAIDLEAALRQPGGPADIVLEAGDRLLVPARLDAVRVIGEVGFPTALVWEHGRKIDWYVNRAGGYLERADKKRSRVVHANGLSQPNKGGHEVLPGSTIMVPVKAPPEGKTTLETMKEIASILASVATVYLVIDRVATN